VRARSGHRGRGRQRHIELQRPVGQHRRRAQAGAAQQPGDPHLVRGHGAVELTHAQVKALIERQTSEYAWQFLYMGADQDAVEVGQGLGIAADHAMTWSRGSAKAAMGATSAMVADLRRARVANPAAGMRAYTEQERAEATAE